MKRYRTVDGRSVRVKKVRQCEVCNDDFNPMFGYDFECRKCRSDTSLDAPEFKVYNCSTCGRSTANRLKCSGCWGQTEPIDDNSVYF